MNATVTLDLETHLKNKASKEKLEQISNILSGIIPLIRSSVMGEQQHEYLAMNPGEIQEKLILCIKVIKS